VATSALKSRLSLSLLLALSLLFTACASAPSRPAIQYTGDAVVDGQAELAVAPPKDKVLWNYRIAGAAMHLGRFDEARLQLDTALPLVGGVIANSADAKKSRRLFSGESDKTFIGEPYERVMAYYYRAVLYWMEGQPDNARACYRSAQLVDSDAEENAFKSDYVLLDYLDAFASAKLGSDGSDTLARALKGTKSSLPAPDPSANVLIFAEYGRGPRKYSGGEYGEQLRFLVNDSPAQGAQLLVDGRTIPLPAYDDLNFQATTRGGRVMDHILGGKAVFKGATDTIGDLSLLGAAIAANNIRDGRGRKNHDAENAAIALGAIGLLSKIASAATVAKADLRCWENIPQRLSFAALRLAPGEYPAKLEFLDANGKLLPARTQSLTLKISASGDSVIFLSEHKP
jgi:tetratricopeptide (TPR) repeat protein